MAHYTQNTKGWHLYLAFEAVRNGYVYTLPGHTDQLRNLATRPIGG